MSHRHGPLPIDLNRYLSLGLLLSKNYKLSLKPMPATCSLNTLGGKPFKRIREHLFGAYMLKTYDMIPDFIFHNIMLYVNVFSSTA